MKDKHPAQRIKINEMQVKIKIYLPYNSAKISLDF